MYVAMVSRPKTKKTMFRLDLLLEKWTMIYKPTHHNPCCSAKPEEKAYFTIDRFDLQNEWQRTFNVLTKPGLLYCTTIEAQLAKDKPRFVIYERNFYLVMKQRPSRSPQTDEEGKHQAKIGLDEMCLDLLAYLFLLQDVANGRLLPKDTPQALRDIVAALTTDDLQGLKGLRLDDTQWWSAPEYKNGWWVLGVELESLEPRRLCVLPERYIASQESSSEDSD